MPQIQYTQSGGVIRWDKTDFLDGYKENQTESFGVFGTLNDHQYPTPFYPSTSKYCLSPQEDVYPISQEVPATGTWSHATKVFTYNSKVYTLLIERLDDVGLVAHSWNFTDKEYDTLSGFPHTITSDADAVGYTSEIYSIQGTASILIAYFDGGTRLDVARYVPGTNTWTDSYLYTTLSITATNAGTHHPMCIGPDGVLYIGNKRTLVAIDGELAVGAANALDLPFHFETTGLATSDKYLIISGYGDETLQNDNVRVLWWDTFSTSWQYDFKLPFRTTSGSSNFYKTHIIFVDNYDEVGTLSYRIAAYDGTGYVVIKDAKPSHQNSKETCLLVNPNSLVMSGGAKLYMNPLNGSISFLPETNHLDPVSILYYLSIGIIYVEDNSIHGSRSGFSGMAYGYYSHWTGTGDISLYSGSASGTKAAMCGYGPLDNAQQGIKWAMFSLKKTGSPTGSFVAKLYKGSGAGSPNNVPSGDAIATSDSHTFGELSTSNWRTITFTFPDIATNHFATNDVVCISIEYSGGDGSNLLKVRTVGSAADSNLALNTGVGGAWVASDNALYMTVWGQDKTVPTIYADLIPARISSRAQIETITIKYAAAGSGGRTFMPSLLVDATSDAYSSGTFTQVDLYTSPVGTISSVASSEDSSKNAISIIRNLPSGLGLPTFSNIGMRLTWYDGLGNTFAPAIESVEIKFTNYAL